jgi:hypothetical protein
LEVARPQPSLTATCVAMTRPQSEFLRVCVTACFVVFLDLFDCCMSLWRCVACPTTELVQQ